MELGHASSDDSGLSREIEAHGDIRPTSVAQAAAVLARPIRETSTEGLEMVEVDLKDSEDVLGRPSPEKAVVEEPPVLRSSMLEEE